MGVDYRAVLAIGKEFEDAREVVEFLEDHNMLSDEDSQVIEDEGYSYIVEILYDRQDGLECECLNLYSGYGYFLGFQVEASSPEKFKDTFDYGLKMWKSVFPNQPAEVIHTVKVY